MFRTISMELTRSVRDHIEVAQQTRCSEPGDGGSTVNQMCQPIPTTFSLRIDLHHNVLMKRALHTLLAMACGGLIIYILIVITCILIARFSVGTPLPERSNSEDAVDAFSDMTVLTKAIRNYMRMYDQLPFASATNADVTISTGTNSELLAELLGKLRVHNHKGINFLVQTPPIPRLDTNRLAFLDPWGTPYFVVFDLNNDGVCTTERWGIIPGPGPFIWSEGVGAIKLWSGIPNAYLATNGFGIVPTSR